MTRRSLDAFGENTANCIPQKICIIFIAVGRKVCVCVFKKKIFYWLHANVYVEWGGGGASAPLFLFSKMIEMG